MKKICFIISILSIILTGCDSSDLSALESAIDSQQEDIIIYPRSASMPDPNRFLKKIKSLPHTRSESREGVVCNNEDMLGHGYSIDNTIIGDYGNVKHPIIDLDKVRKFGSGRIISKDLQQGDTKSQTYYNFERYSDSCSFTRKVASGFSINLGFLSIGRKKLTTEIFKSAFTSSSQSVYGELNIFLRYGQFDLNCTQANIKLYAQKCLTPEFQASLCDGTIGSLITGYGPFVLTGYYTGGKALALYAAYSRSGSSYRLHEKNLQDSINASFTWEKEDASGSGNLNFKLNNGSLSTSQSNIKGTQIQIRTYGGIMQGNAIVGPTDLDKISIDMTDWLKSLENKQTHTMIDIMDGGLVPLSAFIIERNYKDRLDETTQGHLEILKETIEAYIEVVRVYARTSNGEMLYEIAPVLNTRQGDKIVLSDGKYKTANDAELRSNLNDNVYQSKLVEIAKQKRNYFTGISYVQNKSTRLDPRFRQPICIRLDNFNEENAFLFIDKDETTGEDKTGYIYMPSSKVALSFHISPIYGDYVLDDYGIREWVDKLPRKAISPVSLSNYYTIVGLN